MGSLELETIGLEVREAVAWITLNRPLDGGASPPLVGRVGYGRASEIGLLAERIPAGRALDWGMMNRVVSDPELIAATAALTQELAAGAPGSYGAIKRTLNQAAWPDLRQLLDLEAVLQQERATSADFMEGVTTFLQKRPANSTGN